MQNAKSQNVVVNISGQRISELPDSLFKRCDQVEELNLGSSGEVFVTVNSGVKPLPFGTGIRNEFRELNSRIGQLKNLKVIDLSFNDLVTMPTEFYSLPIEEMILNFNYNFDLQGESLNIARLSSLKKLFLVGVKFSSLPDGILSLDLEELAVGNFNLTIDESFIERISKFINLKALYLVDVKMDKLPRNFDILQSLIKLDVRYASTKDIMESVSVLKKMKNLKTINLYYLPLTLKEVNQLSESLPGVEVNFLSK